MTSPDSPSAVQVVRAPAGYAFLGPLLASRAEILSTLLIDGVVVTVAAFARYGFLWMVHIVSPPEGNPPLPLLVLEWILDFGIVGTALVITVFDLCKRIRHAYREISQ
jgi:hypothetical protein